MQELGVSVIAYQPLASGKLTQRQLEREEQGSEVTLLLW
jgi:aryl-alcohol dehydrogenase-like predicted oxidoreductase